MGIRGVCVALATVLVVAGCAEVGEAVDEAGAVADRASVCAEALGLADLNPLVDQERLRERAEDKERRLRELAGDVADEDVKASLLGLADSYLQVQKERLDDAGVVARWVRRNTERLDALRVACT
ncbi:hypothetical protein [Actinophytocola algeriensis]|uniref:Uncharacterized protein n=1 Tax=Actinophytocola algeriensis TaxID=1768010 RepID=A0A7W7VGQ1_9PSEU|nr:hypothetical protein [Actinophytocola algeriensis]MBB4909583.1 hypothetical protein [Actinophytocola algeriensis]MBE1475573.1 hypothetical protein [Actinophytocola algeriensis]